MFCIYLDEFYSVSLCYLNLDLLDWADPLLADDLWPIGGEFLIIPENVAFESLYYCGDELYRSYYKLSTGVNKFVVVFLISGDYDSL